MEGEQPCASKQEHCSCLQVQRPHLNAIGQSAQGLSTSREEHMATESGWEKLLNDRQVVSVIQDQQPLGVLVQPGFDGIDSNHLLLRLLLWQVEQCCHDHEGGDQRLATVSTGPEHGLVI